MRQAIPTKQFVLSGFPGLPSRAKRLLASVSCGVWLVFGIAGCSLKYSTFEIEDFRESGKPKLYSELFKEAYYDIGPDGNLDLILRRSQPSELEPDVSITQVIHIRSVWRSIPGQTVADSTQINATVSYLIVGGPIGATFEGAGSVFFDENRKEDRLEGTLDLAILRPTRRLAAGQEIFNRARVKGEFRAVRDRRRLIHLKNDMNRLFGPLPRD